MKDLKKNGIRNEKGVLLRNIRRKVFRKEQMQHAMGRVIRRVGSVFMIVLSVWGAGLCGRIVMTSHRFLVKHIILEGNTHLKEQDLRKYEDRLTRNIFMLDLISVREELLKEPYVRDADLRRELPDRVYIRIEERIPYAVLRMEGREYLIDKEGMILESAGKKTGKILPVISGLRQDKDGFWKEELSQALSLVETLKSFGYPELSEIREIEMSKNRGAVLHPADGGFDILCGSGDYLHKLVLLKRVSADLARRNWAVRRIDLRFEDQVVVGTGKTA